MNRVRRAWALPIIVLLILVCASMGCGTEIFQGVVSTASPASDLEPSPPATAPVRPPATPLPSPIAPATPERPERFDLYASSIVSYLNQTNGDQDALRALLKDWGALRHATDLLRVDVDDDGIGELLLVIIDPSPEYGVNVEGDLLVLDILKDGYEVAFSAAGSSVLAEPALIEVDDLNRDGFTEIAYSSTSCGAHTCFTTVYILSSGSGTYQDLTSGDIEMAYVDPYFADWDNDQVLDLILHGGLIGSIGAGPQRERTEVYKWDGELYALWETVYDYSNYLYFRVLDANEALLDRDYERAVALYREAIDDPELDVWMESSERDELVAFSRYRLSLTYLLRGEVDLAQAATEELQTHQPGDIYAQVSSVLWTAYQREADLQAACAEVNHFAEAHPEATQVLADYGYANPTFTAQDVCPQQLF